MCFAHSLYKFCAYKFDENCIFFVIWMRKRICVPIWCLFSIFSFICAGITLKHFYNSFPLSIYYVSPLLSQISAAVKHFVRQLINVISCWQLTPKNFFGSAFFMLLAYNKDFFPLAVKMRFFHVPLFVNIRILLSVSLLRCFFFFSSVVFFSSSPWLLQIWFSRCIHMNKRVCGIYYRAASRRPNEAPKIKLNRTTTKADTKQALQRENGIWKLFKCCYTVIGNTKSLSIHLLSTHLCYVRKHTAYLHIANQSLHAFPIKSKSKKSHFNAVMQ